MGSCGTFVLCTASSRCKRIPHHSRIRGRHVLPFLAQISLTQCNTYVHINILDRGLVPKPFSFSQELQFNPLTTEFFPPRQHIFMHSAHTSVIGTPLPQHSLLGGQTWWGPHTWRDPSGNTVNDIHDPHKPSNGRSKVDVSRIFAQHFPKLGPDRTDGTPYTTNLHEYH